MIKQAADHVGQKDDWDRVTLADAGYRSGSNLEECDLSRHKKTSANTPITKNTLATMQTRTAIYALKGRNLPTEEAVRKGTKHGSTGPKELCARGAQPSASVLKKARTPRRDFGPPLGIDGH